MDALAGLAGGRAPVGLVYGSGFEDRTGLLDALALRYAILGNATRTVEAVKRPASLAALCAHAGIAHAAPERIAGPAGAWLEKRAGGSGGAHIRSVPDGASARRGHYMQPWLPGRPVSVAFLANGREARVLGFCEQWTDPAPGQPYRWGGAVRPANLFAPAAEAMTEAAGRVAAAVGLLGLNSIDFLVDGDDCVLLEVNPRPGATLDLFGDVFHQHVEAVRGALGQVPAVAPASAVAVAYARRRVVPPDDFAWPAWTADRQPGGAPVAPGAPLCTVLAEAEDRAAARALVLLRAPAILGLLEAAT
jgi:predicted ATP-grasp superfamily ATP-dependent carboligase